MKYAYAQAIELLTIEAGALESQKNAYFEEIERLQGQLHDTSEKCKLVQRRWSDVQSALSVLRVSE